MNCAICNEPISDIDQQDYPHRTTHIDCPKENVTMTQLVVVHPVKAYGKEQTFITVQTPEEAKSTIDTLLETVPQVGLTVIGEKNVFWVYGKKDDGEYSRTKYTGHPCIGLSLEHLNKPEPTKRPAVTLYTDGACSGNPGPAKAHWVIVMNENARYTGEHSFKADPATNNYAEIGAILCGLTSVKKLMAAYSWHLDMVKVAVMCDSKCALSWIENGVKGKKIANRDAIIQMRDRIHALVTEFEDVQFFHIFGDKNIADPGNK